MSNDEKGEMMAAFFPKGWEVVPADGGFTVRNRKGEEKRVVLEDSFLAVDGTSFNFRNFEDSVSMLVAFVMEAFDGKPRL